MPTGVGGQVDLLSQLALGYRAVPLNGAQKCGIKLIELFGALYPDIRFMPTGGINQDNLIDYLSGANVLCCGGTWLCPEGLMSEERWGEIEQRVKTAVEVLEGRTYNP